MPTLKRIYRTRDGRTDFEFRFTTRPFSETVRVYVGQMPSYGSRDMDGHTTHRYQDAYGQAYVCFEPQPTNLTDAFKVAATWAEKTWQYINTGEKF